ncbi:MAG: phosphatase PAP2 family protein [Myxococcota bacterium]
MAAVVFLGLASQVEPGPIGVDAPILRSVESARHESITGWMVGITDLGGSIGTTVVVFVVVGVLMVARRYRELAFFLVANVGALFLIRALKAAFARPRPSADVVVSITSPQSPSFPSGHALSAMVLYASIFLVALAFDDPRLKRIATAIALILVPLMGITRVYLGVHFPSDVLAGWALGFAWVWVAYLGYRATLTPRGVRP